MNTENFEDAIRRKIEGIDHTYTEDDIDRLHIHVKQKKSWPWKRYGVIIAALFTGMLIGGILTYDIDQPADKELLVQQIDSLQKRLLQRKAIAITTKTDTVYVTKYINDSSKSKNDVNEQSDVAEQSDIIIEHSPTNKKYLSSSKEESGNSGVTNKKSESTSKSYSNEKRVNKNGVQNSETDNRSKQQINEGSTNLSRNTDGSLPDSVEDKRTYERAVVSDYNQASNMVSKNQAIPESIKRDSSKVQLVEVIPLDREEIVKDSLPLKKAKVSSPLLKLSDIKFQAGVGIERANGQVGGGVFGEVSFTKRWSFVAGVKSLDIRDDRYFDANDFHHRKGRDFRNAYIPDRNDTGLIRNIGMHTTILQIPIALNYQVPLKNNYALLISAGTDLDIRAKQSIGYEHRENNLPNTLERIETEYPVKILNNAVFSVGVQKRWKRFVFQASPFISPQFRSVAYKKEDLYLGFRLRAFYSFGK